MDETPSPTPPESGAPFDPESGLKKKKKKVGPTASFPMAVADQLPGRTLAKPEELVPGARVQHASFGVGVIEALDPGESPAKAKVRVKFEAFEVPKTLVLRHAKLALS